MGICHWDTFCLSSKVTFKLFILFYFFCMNIYGEIFHNINSAIICYLGAFAFRLHKWYTNSKNRNTRRKYLKFGKEIWAAERTESNNKIEQNNPLSGDHIRQIKISNDFYVRFVIWPTWSPYNFMASTRATRTKQIVSVHRGDYTQTSSYRPWRASGEQREYHETVNIRRSYKIRLCHTKASYNL